MANSPDALEMIGEVVDIVPGGKYKVNLAEVGLEVMGYRSGKMRKNNIEILPGDYVKIEVNQYDTSK